MLGNHTLYDKHPCNIASLLCSEKIDLEPNLVFGFITTARPHTLGCKLLSRIYPHACLKA